MVSPRMAAFNDSLALEALFSTFRFRERAKCGEIAEVRRLPSNSVKEPWRSATRGLRMAFKALVVGSSAGADDDAGASGASGAADAVDGWVLVEQQEVVMVVLWRRIRTRIDVK
jgi:hypothetical protein